jgi:hypothetical protein
MINANPKNLPPNSYKEPKNLSDQTPFGNGDVSVTKITNPNGRPGIATS